MRASVSQYVLKVHSRCDLACDHCYVYAHADQSWRAKPKVIAEATVSQAALRIAEHARTHALDVVHVVLHGGEPLLLGHDGLRMVMGWLRSTLDPVAELDLRIHTNGVRLDEKMCALFADHDVRVGVSLDGDAASNDRHRRFRNGEGSHAQVRRALSLLRQPVYRRLYSGILCTVDVRNDPIAVYEALLAEEPPRVDLLLPHATHEDPPYRPAGTDTAYAAWLTAVHARWLTDGRPFSIRYFDSLVAAWEGRPSQSEAAGLDPVDLLVIETDGTWEQADSLKTAYADAPATGLDVFSHSADEAMAHPGVMARQAGIDGVCSTCRACPLVRACGGGLYAHRYRSDNDFDNPTVYCDDLKALIPRILAAPRSAQKVRIREDGAKPSHCLPAGAFESLSAGPGDPAAMASLADSYWSVLRALVATVASGLDENAGDFGRAAADGWRLLSALDTDRPEAVREVLTYPFVQAWAEQCLRMKEGEELDLNRAHLACLAAAAALRAGLEAELTLPVRDGAIYVPTAGALIVGAEAGRVAAVRITRSGISSPFAPGSWQSVRRVSEDGLSVTVEDIDPFRDCQSWAPSGRLLPGEWQAWRSGLTAAARQLMAELPAYASVIRTGLRSVVPMRQEGSGYERSGTARQAFGAVALALPENTATLATLLLHEMQHVKLAALCDLFDLFDRADNRRFSVPWRSDTRPLEGLLHGTYAHLAIAELWRSRHRQRPGEDASRNFLMYRWWVTEAVDVLLNSGALLPDGERFVHGMRASVDAWAHDE